MPKPNPSQPLLVVGFALLVLGSLVVFVVPALITSYFVAKDGLGVVANTLPMVVVGAVASFLGLIFLLVGISRAAAGIDYLISVAGEPVPGIQSRAQEHWFSQE